MQKNVMKIELIRVIKTSVTDKYLKELLEKSLNKYKDRLVWLEKNEYSFHVLAEIEYGGLIENTSWPEFDHAVIYLQINKDIALHYKLVWW